jgi:hypothetical protein
MSCQASNSYLALTFIAACAAASLLPVPPRRLMDAAKYVLSDKQQIHCADVYCCLRCCFPASNLTPQAYECGRVRAVRQAAIIWHLHLLLLELLRPCLIINPIGSWMLPSTFYQTSSTSLA